MRNIKITLNDRRLGLIASAAPLVDTSSRRLLPKRTDPINQQGAVLAYTQLPADLNDLKSGWRTVRRIRGAPKILARTVPAMQRQTMTANEVYRQLSDAYGRGDLEPETMEEHRGEKDDDGEELDGLDLDSEVDVKEEQPSVPEGRIGKAEVESRDEGFGGGREAEDFANNIEVDEKGRVHKRNDMTRGRKRRT